MSISKIFIPNSLCVFSQIIDRKHIEQNFPSVARVMPRSGTCGCWGESKTLALGFAMASHRLRAVVNNYRGKPGWGGGGGGGGGGSDIVNIHEQFPDLAEGEILLLARRLRAKIVLFRIQA